MQSVLENLQSAVQSAKDILALAKDVEATFKKKHFKGFKLGAVKVTKGVVRAQFTCQSGKYSLVASKQDVEVWKGKYLEVKAASIAAALASLNP